MYWHVYKTNGEKGDYNIDNHLTLEMSSMFGKLVNGENDWLWIERFVSPNTTECPNRAFFYTSNVLELLADMKMEFSKALASLSKYFAEYAQATSVSLNQVRETIKDIYWKMYLNRRFQIEEKWEHFFFLASQTGIRDAGAGGSLLRPSSDEVPAALFADLYGLDGESDGFADAVDIACVKDKKKLKVEGEKQIKDLSANNQKLQQFTLQKYQDYVQSMNKILQFKQELKVLKDKNELPSLEELQKMQKLFD